MISGESFPFVKALDFATKEQLLNRLQGIKSGAAELAAPDNAIVREMTEACIREIAVCSETELLRLKRYLKHQKRSGVRKNER
jgi:hypothetical protein